MDAIEYLLRDHENHRKGLKELLEMDIKNPDRRKFFIGFRDDLIKHVNIEEEVFYPRLLKVESLEQHVLEAWEDHNLVMQLLQEMDDEKLDLKKWQAKLSTLGKLLVAHLDDEETDLFPEVRRLASSEFLKEIGEQMVVHKKLTVPEEVLYPDEPETHRPENLNL